MKISFQKIEKKNLDVFSVEFIKELREKKEAKKMENAMKFIKKVEIEDLLFNEYCKMINERKELRARENKIYLNSIEERWAIFLYNLKVTDEKWEEIKKKFDNFKKEITNDIDQGQLIQNPGYYNNYVNEQLSKFCDYESELSVLEEIGEGFKYVKNKIINVFEEKKKNLTQKNI